MNDALPEALKVALDSEILLDEWDEPPHLHLVLTRPSDGTPYMMPLPIPEDVWLRFVPYEVLSMTAVMIETAPPIELDASVADITGLTFFCEGWSLKSKSHDEEDARRLQEWAQNNSIAEHPDRIEVKMISSITKEGDRYLLVYERGEPEPMDVIAVLHDDDEEPGDEPKVDGRVFEALEALLTNFLAKVTWTNG